MAGAQPAGATAILLGELKTHNIFIVRVRLFSTIVNGRQLASRCALQLKGK